MSTKTKNYQFVKPEENEFYDISIPNANWDIADAELKRRVPEDGDISGTQVSTLGTITEEFPIPAAGDTTKTIVGKIKKFFEDFKNLKSSLLLVNQVVNNCTTDRGDLPGAAAQLKVLMDLYTKLNNNVTIKNNGSITFPLANGGNIILTNLSNKTAVQFAYQASGATSWTSTPMQIIQDGICNINGRAETVSYVMPNLKIVTGAANYSLNAGLGAALYLNISVSSGYTPIGVMSYNTGSNEIVPTLIRINSSTQIRIDLKNFSTINIIDTTVSVQVLCVK